MSSGRGLAMMNEMMPPADTPNAKGENYKNDPRAPSLWQQARLELLGFALAMERSNQGLTAAQLRMAIALADDHPNVKPTDRRAGTMPPEEHVFVGENQPGDTHSRIG